MKTASEDEERRPSYLYRRCEICERPLVGVLVDSIKPPRTYCYDCCEHHNLDYFGNTKKEGA